MEGRKILQWGLGVLVVLIIIGYSFFVLNDFIRGPRIVITSPKSGFSTTTPIIVISGKTIHANNLTINDAVTPVDLEGNFRSQLILAPGYNIMKIIAEDNYARRAEKTVEIVLVVPEEVSATSSLTIEAGINFVSVPGCYPGYIFSIVSGKRCPQ